MCACRNIKSMIHKGFCRFRGISLAPHIPADGPTYLISPVSFTLLQINAAYDLPI